MPWWDDYKKAFLNGIDPIAAIGETVSQHAQQVPPPASPTPPLPERWWNNAAPHPLFPVPQPGAPTDFGGQGIPNPDNVRPMPDTQMPAAPLSGGQFSRDNFRGQMPLRLAFPTLNGLLRQQS